MASKSTKKREHPEEIYKKLNRDHVKIKDKDMKTNNTILHSVLKELLEIMKKHNPTFKKMNPQLKYLGSYFDGLRVGKPTEFDINVLLNIPINYDKIKMKATESLCDSTYIFMQSEFRRLSKKENDAFQETKLWCDTQYRLSVKMFRSWMQKVVDTALGKLEKDNDRPAICVNNKRYQIWSKISGPANTITIITGNSDKDIIDVDLVPTFSFKLPKKPNDTKIMFEKVEATKIKEYFVVPKPTEDEFSWRLAFPFQERYYINKNNNLKSALKLVKLFRDVQDFKQLASYYIKTLFLWEVQDQRNEEFWKLNSLSFLVLHMLKKLKDCLSKREIKNFWCPEANLIMGKIGPNTCQNWSNRLCKIINNFETKSKVNPEIITKYFKPKK